MDNTSAATLVYTLTIQLAVLAIGSFSLFLGYRLIVKYQKTVPAIIFSVFGILIISSSLYKVLLGGSEIRHSALHANNDDSIDNNSLYTDFKNGREEKKRHEEKIKEFNQAIEEAKNLYESKELEAAIKALFEAISQPDITLKTSAKAFDSLAWMHREKNRKNESLIFSKIAIATDASNPIYLDTMVYTLLDLGKIEDAELAAKRALKLDPHDLSRQNTLYKISQQRRALLRGND